MPLPFDSRNENIFQRLGAWAILVTSGHAYRYDIVKSRGPQKSTGSPEVERVRQDVTVLDLRALANGPIKSDQSCQVGG